MDDQFKLNKLLDYIDIVSVIGSKLNLNKKGANYWAVCPFHNDTKPSLSVSPTKKMFKCFSCNVAGNAVYFLQKLENIPYIQALKQALELSNVDPSVFSVLANNFKVSIEQKIALVNKQAMELMQAYLFIQAETNEHVKAFLNKRQIDLKTIEKFNLGYLDKNYQNQFISHLKEFCLQSFKDEVADDLLNKTNLIAYNEQKQETYLFFNNRLIIPIIDNFQNVVGFSGRDLSDQANAKYINSPESNLFIKGDVLYNFNNVINHNEHKSLIIVEGYFDCITLSNHDYINTVATMGVALTTDQLKLIFSLKDLQEIILSFDNDQAGQAAFSKNLMILLNYQLTKSTFIPIYISGLFTSSCKDPDELFKTKNNATNIFNKKQNALLIALVFLVRSNNNLDYVLNEAIDLLVKYDKTNKFGLYVINAKKMFKLFLSDQYQLDKDQFDKIYESRFNRYDLNLNNKTWTNQKPKEKSFFNKQYLKPQLSVKEVIFNKHLSQIKDAIDSLYVNYNVLLAILVFYPSLVLKYKKEIENTNQKIFNLIKSDEHFKMIIQALKKRNFDNVLEKLQNPIYKQQFEAYVFLFYIFDELIIELDLKDNEYINNLNILKQSDILSHWFNEDEIFKNTQYLKKMFEHFSLLDLKTEISLNDLNNPYPEIKEKITRCLLNIQKLMSVILTQLWNIQTSNLIANN